MHFCIPSQAMPRGVELPQASAWQGIIGSGPKCSNPRDIFSSWGPNAGIFVA